MQLRLSEALPLAAIAIGVLVSTALGLEGPTASFFALFSILAAGYLIGPRLIDSRTWWLPMCWGVLASVATLMLLRGVWFYIPGATLDAWGNAWTTVGLMLIALIVVATVPGDLLESTPDTPTAQGARWKQWVSLTAACVAIGGFLLIADAAIRHGTAEAIRTPWPFMPQGTLAVTASLWALLLVSAWTFRRPGVAAIHAACAIGATVVIAPLLYQIGYGFDGFLHVAGEQVLAATGTLLPKPPYYMGQYVFVTWLAGLFNLDIAQVDRWLVPITAMTLIPAALAVTMRRARAASTMLPALILLPLGAFVATTPHGFATTLGVTALILALNIPSRETETGSPVRHAAMPLLFAAWSALTHPLVGLPILFTIISLACWRGRARGFIAIPTAILAGVSVPLLFGLAAGLGSASGVQFDPGRLFDPAVWSGLLSGFIPWVPNHYALWPQASVWVEKLLPWIVGIFAAMSLVRRNADGRIRAPYAIAAGSTFVAALILRMAGDFGFLIDYERGNYADRLFLVALLLLLPIALPELGRRLERAGRAPMAQKLAVLVTIGLLGAGASYAALPRHDAVTPSRGWSVGYADRSAVRLIDQDAQGAPYTVLANQNVSAAAVDAFGFKRYNGDVFFYPIPTGGPLYDVFLRASYQDASRDTMQEAGRLGGSDLVYFVVNDYWWDAERLSETASSSSDRMFDVENGAVKIFKYDLLK